MRDMRVRSLDVLFSVRFVAISPFLSESCTGHRICYLSDFSEMRGGGDIS